jgi:hypothetical protein
MIVATLVREGINKHRARELADHFAAQPEQEPVAYDKTEMNSFVIDLYEEKMKEGKHGHYEALFHCVHQAIARVTPPLPVQEPVARVAEVHMSRYTLEWTNGPIPEGTELFSAQPPLPVQPVRQPLTDEEIAEVAELMEAIDATDSFWREFARAIEAAHGIKENT